MVAIDKNKLHEALLKLDVTLTQPVTLIAIGGTALSLFELKENTHDIDCMIESDDELLRVDVIVSFHKMGYSTEIQEKGTIVLFDLPPDYIKRAISYDKNDSFKNLRLLILSPLDVLLTKLSRYEQKDRVDIAAILMTFKFSWAEIEARFKLYESLYRGNKEMLKQKFESFREQYDALMA